jgi:hypothetical protein
LDERTPQPQLPARLHRHLDTSVYDIRTLVARHRAIAMLIARRRGHGELVDADTDLVIEGFPRCASTFAVAAFRLAQEPRAVRLAHHTHAPAQVFEALRLRVPALVLIREPEDAIISLLIRDRWLSPASALRGFIRFYEPLCPRRGEFVVGRFDEVVRAFGTIIRRVNERFAKRFGEFEHTEGNVERILREIEEDERTRRSGHELERAIPRPSQTRDVLRDDVRRSYRSTSPALRARAERVYALFTA